MGKKLSEIERGAGLFMGLVTGLMDVVREMNVPFEVIYRLVTPDGRSTLEKMVEVARAGWLEENKDAVPKSSAPLTIEEYELEADRDLDFDQGVALGMHDYTVPDATAERFPIVGSGKSKVKARLVCLHRNPGDAANENEVSNVLAAMGFKLGDTAVTLAFGAQHREVQRQKRIMSGAFYTHADGSRGYLSLGNHNGKRRLFLYWVRPGVKLDNNLWFLAVPI